MKALTTVIQPDGDVSLPAEVLEALRLSAGSKLVFLVEEGRVVLQPLLADTLESLKGLYPSDRDIVAELQQERRQDKW